MAEDDAGRYGPVALYVGGTAEVRFRNIAFNDLALRTRADEKVSTRFRMQRLSDFYYGWGASADDFDHDGVLDVVSGPHIYFGPDYRRSREIYLALTTNPSNAFATRLLDAVLGRLHRGWVGRRHQCQLLGQQLRRDAVREPQGGSAPVGQLPRRARAAD